MNKQDDEFHFWAPLEISKGKDKDGVEKMVLGGIASTIDKDADGEFLDPNGFDINDFRELGVVNWHHQAKDQPSAIVGEPTKVELRPEGFYVETTLYKSSKVAQDVWELAQTMKRDSKNRRLGYSIEGQVVERGSDDETHPDYNVVKKAKITGLAITHMPKNPKTFAEIIKGFSGESFSSAPKAEASEDSEEENGLSTKTGKPLMKESVNKKLKTLQKSYKIIDLDENSTIDKIFETFTNINIEKARNIFTILKAMKNKKVTNNQIEKAMDSLGLSYDESNPFLIKGEESEEMAENPAKTSAMKKMEGVDPDEVADQISNLSKKKTEGEEEDETEEIEKGISHDIGRATVKILSKKIEKSNQDNFRQNQAIATLLKANGEQLQKSMEVNGELKDIIASQNRVIKGLANAFGSAPQARKSITKSFTEKESFQKGKSNMGDGQPTLSMKGNYKEVLNLVDEMTFAKGGYDNEMSKATMSFESKKVLPSNIISRIQAERGITIID